MVISSRKFENVLSSGSHETGSRLKKVTASESAKPGPHIHIFFLSQWSRVSVEMGTKCEKVCMWGIDAIKFLWRSGERAGG